MHPDLSDTLLPGINVFFAFVGVVLLIGFVTALVVATVRGSRRVATGPDWDAALRRLAGTPSIEDQLADVERRFAARLITADEREAARIRILSGLH